MRTLRWTLVICGLLVAGPITALAQSVDPLTGGRLTDPSIVFRGQSDAGFFDPSGGPPGPGGQVYPGPDGSAYPPGAEMGGGLPPGANPWPQISPYENSFEQHRQVDGLWEYESNRLNRRWYGGVEYLSLWYKKPGDRQIGYPKSLLTGADLLQVRRLSAIPDDQNSSGVKAFVGFNNPDGSSFEFSGFYGGSPSEPVAFPQRNLNNRSPAVINALGEFVEVDRIDLFTGLLSNDPITFDSQFDVNYDQSSFGVEGNYFGMPILGRGSFLIRPIAGIRYINLHENMTIHGWDRQRFGHVNITSTVDSNMVGPQGGLQLEMGGENLKIKLFTLGGALANMDVEKINADNYDTFSVREQERHTKLSPLWDYGVQAEAPIFSFIPYLKKIPYLRSSITRVGYRYTNVYLVQRPADLITYGDPVPVIDSERTRWALSTFDIGFRWNW